MSESARLSRSQFGKDCNAWSNSARNFVLYRCKKICTCHRSPQEFEELVAEVVPIGNELANWDFAIGGTIFRSLTLPRVK